MDKQKYEPSPSDIAWTTNLIASLNEGGIWQNSWGVIQVSKSKKTALFKRYAEDKVLPLNSFQDAANMPSTKEMIHRFRANFEKIGFEFIVAKETIKLQS